MNELNKLKENFQFWIFSNPQYAGGIKLVAALLMILLIIGIARCDFKPKHVVKETVAATVKVDSTVTNPSVEKSAYLDYNAIVQALGNGEVSDKEVTLWINGIVRKEIYKYHIVDGKIVLR